MKPHRFLNVVVHECRGAPRPCFSETLVKTAKLESSSKLDNDTTALLNVGLRVCSSGCNLNLKQKISRWELRRPKTIQDLDVVRGEVDVALLSVLLLREDTQAEPLRLPNMFDDLEMRCQGCIAINFVNFIGPTV